MPNKLIECVPNFSEGRNLEIIKQITDEIQKVKDVKLLDVDPGFDMNRTVVTFIGSPEGVKEAAFQAIKKAAELIDMSNHKGSHPRMGATDVCPFIPVNDVSELECIEISHEVAKRVAEELNIPVYLYEKSARIPERKNLAFIRQGEYEGLAEKIIKPEWKPDYGMAKFNSKSGATVIGVREFLIAYNINLNTREVNYATDIAYELREKGRSARRGNIYPFYFKGQEILKYEKDKYPCGNCEFIGSTLDETIEHCKSIHNYDLIELLKLNAIDVNKIEGESVKKPGMFKNCKAIGWAVEKFNCSQISINLTDFRITSMHHVYEAARKLADERGIVVTGSEIVGMVPFEALLETGKFYLKKQNRSAGIPVKDILETAVQSLGLRDLSEFNLEERVLGLPKSEEKDLVNMSVKDFVDEVSRESPAPGGGSIAALSGSLASALTSMVCNLTSNKRGSENIDKILFDTAEKCQKIKDRLLSLIDEDTNAFNQYMEARKLPQNNSVEKQKRTEAMQQGLKNAVLVPLETAKLSLQTIELAEIGIQFGNPNSITDVGVGAQMGYAGLLGGIYNVLINLKSIKDEAFVAEMKNECNELKKIAEEKIKKIEAVVLQKIS